MKEIPILFNGEMVRAILAGRKTQTRRPVKGIEGPGTIYLHDTTYQILKNGKLIKPPFGKPGDVLWVRETTGLQVRNDCVGGSGEFRVYKADNPDAMRYDYRPTHGPSGAHKKMTWIPSIHMPKHASRIKLRVERVWVERVQDITQNGIWEEGVRPLLEAGTDVDIDGGLWPAGVRKCKREFSKLWDSIYKTWDSNPWVWCCEFEVINQKENHMPDKVITKEALRNLRKKLKMTQVEFAEYIGVSRHTVESYEQGRLAIPNHLSTNPKTEHLTKR